MSRPRASFQVAFRPWFWVLLAVWFVTGCATVGPDYVAPRTSLPSAWQNESKAGLASREADPEALATWWTALNDPTLSGLIQRAVEGNLDLKKAWARLREARARRGLAKSQLFPTLQGTGSSSGTWKSEDSGTGKTSDFYTLSIDATWELDIFGGARRSVEAAEADLQASREELRGVLVSLLGEVALNYVEVRTIQTRLRIAHSNLKTQEETYQLVRWRYEAGLTDKLALEQARYNLESTRSQIPTLRTGLEEAKNRLAVLLGEPSGRVQKELEEPKSIPVPPLKVAVGVPADVLRQRPDIRRAERQLAAQTARIGVATAELYPKLTLSGSIGLETLSLGHPASGVASLSGGPKITWAIFKAGAIRQNIEVQSALQEQYLIAYQTTVLSALEEVENALVAYAEEQSRLQSLKEAARAAEEAVELAGQKYQSGLTDFGDVLEAQRSLLSLQDQQVRSEGEIVSNLVRLYKALGGGWATLVLDEEELFPRGEKP